MKAIVIYYSLEGHTQIVAKEIARELNCDIFKLKLQKPYPDKGFKKYLLGGYAAMTRKTPALESMPEIESYDTIILGMSIWAGKPAPPIRSFITNKNISNKKIALFASSGSGNAIEAFAELKVELSGNELLGTLSVKDKENETLDKTVSNWLGEIILEQEETQI